MSGQDRHKKILDKMHDIYVSKNHDYDDSFSYIYQKYGQNHALAMIETKFRRLESLNKKTAQVANESAIDSLYDLANYAVLTIMEIEKSDNSEKKSR